MQFIFLKEINDQRYQTLFEDQLKHSSMEVSFCAFSNNSTQLRKACACVSGVISSKVGLVNADRFQLQQLEK